MNNKLLSNSTLQHLIAKSETEKRGAFLAGMAYVLEELDRRHPEWDLRTLMPAMLQELSAASAASTSAPTDTPSAPQSSPAIPATLYGADGELL